MRENNRKRGMLVERLSIDREGGREKKRFVDEKRRLSTET